MKKIIFVLGILVILFGFNTNAHEDGPPPPPPEAQLTAYPYYIDFGNVNIGSTSEQTLTLVTHVQQPEPKK